MKESLPLYNTYRHRLSQTKLFKGLSLDLLDDMLSHFRFESWSKGSQHNSKIALQRFYVILEGRMELKQMHPKTGKQITMFLLKEGDVYDVLTLLDEQEHNIIPVARDDLKLLSAPIDEVRTWVERHPEFNKNYLPYLGHCIRHREALVTDLALYEIQTRLARLILRYIPSETSYYELPGEGIDVTLLHDLSNEVLADMVGSVRQVVNRHLQFMKKEGVLHYENHHLIIDDLVKLKQYADELI